MSVLIGANFFALYSTVLNENNTAEETQSADSIYQHPDNIPSKTLDFSDCQHTSRYSAENFIHTNPEKPGR